MNAPSAPSSQSSPSVSPAQAAPHTAPDDGSLTAVRLVQVRKTYPNGLGETEALRSVSVALRPGSFTAVMGPSGSGKSTFLNCAAGLDVPTSGQVVVGDVDLTTLSADDLTRFRRRRVGFVFQSYNLVRHLTVAENVQLPLLLDGRRPDPAWQEHLLMAVGLQGMEDRLPGQLSGGQAQRVAIARALVTRPTVVFADEPTGALDSRTGQQILDVLRATARELDQTLVLVTHDPRVATAADQVLFLADGNVVGHLEAPSVEQITAQLVASGR
ncbi:ABC transporter ATP-binding protein [Sanguibacter suaedae]|uniref:ABC transporter ATP-binding protein n=1 Tax=Sanguibacter suaedae TaxID=2795737 RepID=A0A934I4W0_9MICO|nr:ABC transporter ATP-binding protein [Sanguibacter suaedae]MBI9115624.1 ABC transporter ATP-binding protein [Sanguibacter suaedae]